MKEKLFVIQIAIVFLIFAFTLEVMAETVESVPIESTEGTTLETNEPQSSETEVDEEPNYTKYLLIGFFCIWAYRLVANVSSLLWLNHYDHEYTLYLSNHEKNFTENTGPLVQLFKGAGVADRQIPYVEPMGYNQILQGHTLLFTNIGNLRDSVIANMIACFAEAKGVYKQRIRECFSPLFWIRSLLFLPRTILEYLGVKGDSFITKLLQLLYWFVTPILIVFRDYFNQYIISFFGQFG